RARAQAGRAHRAGERLHGRLLHRARGPDGAAMILALLATAAVSSHGAVAAAHPLAAEAGASILRRGGNAVDAAVAAAFALNVVEPESSGIGGGGFALVYVAREKKVHVIDFREAAPMAATPGMFVIDGKPRPDLSDA